MLNLWIFGLIMFFLGAIFSELFCGLLLILGLVLLIIIPVLLIGLPILLVCIPCVLIYSMVKLLRREDDGEF